MFITNYLKRTIPVRSFQNGDVRYSDLYDWFNCMEMGPCHGWMTSDESLRRETTRRADELTGVLKRMAETLRFDAFDLHFRPNPFRQVISDWVDKGGEVWQLIEPVDSLHPTQAAQPLIAREFWGVMEREMPEVIGPVNPRNDDIRRLFGDQNGH